MVRVPILILAGAVLGRGWLAAQPDSVRAARFDQLYNVAALIEGGSIRPGWLADGVSFWYAEGSPANTVIHRVDGRTGARTPMFDSARLRRAVAAALGHDPPYAGIPFSEFRLVDNERAAVFALEGHEFRLDLATYSIARLPAQTPLERDRTTPRLVRAAYPTTGTDLFELPSPDGRWLAGQREHDLWLRATADGRLQRLTGDGTRERAWELAGARWSPDGLRLAAVRIDNRGVAEMPVVHWLKPVEEVEWRYFTKAGGRLPTPELHLIDVVSGRIIPVDLGEDPEPYLSIVDFTPDGRTLLVLANNREQKRLRLLAVDPATGSVRVVLTETQPTFIKGIAQNPGWTNLITLLPDGRRFLWISERDGWDHLYLYDLNGGLLRRLTQGAWPVLQVVTVDAGGEWVYFTGHRERERPYDTHVYRVRLDGSGLARLTEGEGQHQAVFSPGRSVFLDTHSSHGRPPVVELRSSDGRLIETLARANIGRLRALGWTEPEEVVVKAADGVTDLWGLVVKPLDFDPGRRYPVVEYIYGGPQTTWVPRRFGAWALPQAIAAQGVVVWIVDGRGTPERGKAFQDHVYGRFGQTEIPDHAAALRQLLGARPYLDSTRVGIVGGSWGGYLTVRAMVLAPELYRVGAAIYPVVEMYDHAAAAIEPYMGTPLSNPAGYVEGSSVARVERLSGHLLLLHGTSDVNATFSATMKMVEALTRAGKPYDLAVFPELNHGLAGTSGRYLLHRVRRHFIQYLSP